MSHPRVPKVMNKNLIFLFIKNSLKKKVREKGVNSKILYCQYDNINPTILVHESWTDINVL